jgi:hypothetical protein
MSMRRNHIVALPLLMIVSMALGAEKTESFNHDPNWDGHNNRPTADPVTIRQDFGYSKTSHAGGKPGELGGFIMPASEAAYYAKAIPTATFKDKLSASGTFMSPNGQYHILVGFFNSDTVNEWRTPNSIVLRLQGRGDRFLAYLEYLTSKWRIGALGGHGFETTSVPQTGKPDSSGFVSGGKVYKWSITYDPAANDGKGVITATIGDQTSTTELDPAYTKDGATFNRFGILTIVKSYDTGGEVWFDDITINGKLDTFDKDPNWEGVRNRGSYPSQGVRPRFDVGFTNTQIAGGRAKGEIGGLFYRGDCRYPDRMGYYGDRVGPLRLDKPIRASGKVAMTRGVSDSTTLFGFFNSKQSIEKSDRQDMASPKSFLGVVVEGPSSEGFYFYPGSRNNGEIENWGGRVSPPLTIYPDGKSHDWALQYDPRGEGKITVSLDGRSVEIALKPGQKDAATVFDRFGFITTWIDGNGQKVYFDDLTYTVSQ